MPIPILRNAGRVPNLGFFHIPWYLNSLGFFLILGCGGCTLFASRPVQEMSFTAAAIRAAREVQADTLAPELYRQSNEWFFRARHEYKFKNFKLAKKYADKARSLAEQAEFESLRNGGIRGEHSSMAPDPLARDPLRPNETSPPEPKQEPYDYPTPDGTPADVYEQRKAAEEKAATPPPAPPVPTPAPGP